MAQSYVSSTSSSTTKPKVIGLYGVPGCGKSTLLQQITNYLDPEKFAFYEGTEQLLKVFSGSLDKFKQLPEVMKQQHRENAIRSIGKECAATSKTGVVTGHFLLWDPEKSKSDPIWTPNGDAEIYTHVIYLDIAPDIVKDQRESDTERQRPVVTEEHLIQWQEAEREGLRQICYKHGILFTTLSKSYATLVEKTAELLRDFRGQDEQHNSDCALKQVDQVMSELSSVSAPPRDSQTILVVDADKTLAPLDTGALFWKEGKKSVQNEEQLRTLFDSQSDQTRYTYPTFRQAQLMYNEVSEQSQFNAMCRTVANKVKLYPEFKALFKQISTSKNTPAIIVTCGLSRVWEHVVKDLGLAQTVKVVGAGRIAGEPPMNRFVVTPEVKKEVVAHLQQRYKSYVWAFGDSVVDMPMMQQADRAIIITGDKTIRSKSMEKILEDAIEDHGFVAQQVLLPGTVTPRLNEEVLPVTTLADLLRNDINPEPQNSRIHFQHATSKPASKLLARATRDQRISGPQLREAHRKIGQYLALEYVAAHIGCEKIQIPHVQGNMTTAHRLLHEERTLIIPLMRGGEPMALGVSDAFPAAAFLHADEAEDVSSAYVEGKTTIVLVDSVVNTGASLVPFIQRLRALRFVGRIVVVAGVVQEDAVKEGGALRAGIEGLGTVGLFALRVSGNSYKGQGGTDTGHRLFNTVYLDG